MDKKEYIDNQINHLFIHWLSLVCLWGAAVFVLLGVMDYFVAPENFKLFVFSRLLTSSFLVLMFALAKKFSSSSIKVHQTLAYLVIIGAAAGIEFTILKHGGHASIYYSGMVLLGILVIGFIPATLSFHVTGALLLYGIYIIPIALMDKISDFRFFITANSFVVFSCISILLLRYLHDRSLVNEFGLQYDLMSDQNRLSTMVKNRTAELTGTVAQLSGQVAERERAEAKVRAQIQRQQALRTIDMIITASHDLQSILEVLLSEIVAKLHVDAADVLLLIPGTGMLQYAGHKGFKTKRITDIHLKIGQGYAGSVISNREKIIIPDLQTVETMRISPGEYEFSQAFLIQEEGFRSYIGVPLIAKGQVKGVLEIFHRSSLSPEDDWLDFLNAFASQAAIALDNVTLRENLELSKEEVLKAYDLTIEGLARAIDYRDHATKGHSQRVTNMTLKISKMMGLNSDELIHIRRGALLHDIGKISIPDSILFKAGPLNDEEWLINRMHPLIAYEMLSPVSFLAPALDIPYCHHEKWDGTGYPQGLKGEEIPLAARIFAVVDIWDALKSNRPYRPAWSDEKVVEHIRSIAGTHLDPKVVEVFLFMQDTAEKLSSPMIPDGSEGHEDEFSSLLDQDPYFYFEE